MDINIAELASMGEQGYVRKTVHPDGRLELFNYTDKCTYEGVWNETTRQCRGLILDLAGAVVALPFAKFFNWGEGHAPELDLDAPVTVTDKLDGSLGILYQAHPREWAIATRGSFTSDQAIHATEVLRARYAHWGPPEGTTCLFEIIYPENRIVVDYGDTDDLIFLGARDIATGSDVEIDWPGPATTFHPYATLRLALEAEPRAGQEGLVVFFPDSGKRVKIKQDDYVAIHRLVFGLTARRVWENAGVHDLSGIDLTPKQIGIALQMDPNDVQGILDAAPAGNWMDELLTIVPEEFAAWAVQTRDRIVAEVVTWERRVKMTYGLVDASHPTGRREAAALIQAENKEIHGALFALLDGKPIRAFAWRVVRPEHETFKREEGE